MSQHILIIDEEGAPHSGLAEYLGARGLTLRSCSDAHRGLVELDQGDYDALIVGVPADMARLELCRQVRARSQIPILILSDGEEARNPAVAFDHGADDFLRKPFTSRKLLARVKAVLRRRREGGAAQRVLRFGRLEIDRPRREVRLDGTPRELTNHQFELLLLLAERPRQVQSREQLMQALHGRPLEEYDRSIDVHISRIRGAIEDDPQKPRRIKTVRSTGYVFMPDDE